MQKTIYVDISSVEECKENTWGIEAFGYLPDEYHKLLVEHLGIESTECCQITGIVTENTTGSDSILLELEEVWEPEKHMTEWKTFHVDPSFGILYLGYLPIGDRKIPVACDQNAAPVGFSFNPMHLEYIQSVLQTNNQDLKLLIGASSDLQIKALRDLDAK